tara:strand:+ start:287 stop:685 length:399 start_codon:yes stop_codon:yes gene_type:complete
MVNKIRTSSTQTTRSLTVFFDGSCPICSKEINFYKMRAGADELSWVDVSDEEIPIPIQTRSREELMARFHVLSSSGELVSGGAAFAELWASLPAFKIFGKIFKLPILRYLIDVGYDIFLTLRPKFQNLFHKR